jgi:hypothetical protein
MKNGYGVMVMCVNGKATNRLVHRASAFAFKRFDILSPLQILHKCDVRNCFNPDHLFEGDQLDNVRDMWAKGRRTNAQQRFPQKLTVDDVIRIRSIYSAGGCTTRSIANELGLGKSTVSAIIRREIWSHV